MERPEVLAVFGAAVGDRLRRHRAENAEIDVLCATALQWERSLESEVSFRTEPTDMDGKAVIVDRIDGVLSPKFDIDGDSLPHLAEGYQWRLSAQASLKPDGSVGVWFQCVLLRPHGPQSALVRRSAITGRLSHSQEWSPSGELCVELLRMAMKLLPGFISDGLTLALLGHSMPHDAPPPPRG